MSQSRNKRTSKKASGKTENTEVRIVYRNQISKKTAAIISAVVIALIAIIILISNYFSTDGKFLRLKVITIDDISISMDYFLKRAKLSGSDPLALLSVIAKEQVISLVAEREGLEINDTAIDQELRNIAKGDSDIISEQEFKEWYRQTLNESRLSDKEYRELVSVSLISDIIVESLEAQLPTEAEQIHAHIIMTVTENEAENIISRVKAGEDFATIARNESIDSITRENGGDLGWTPYGVLSPQIESVIWDMNPGDISEPIIYYDTNDPTNMEPLGFYVIWVSEKSESREIDEVFIPTLVNNAFNEWYTAESKNHAIQYHGLHNGFDSEAYAWINWQLSKLEE